MQIMLLYIFIDFRSGKNKIHLNLASFSNLWKLWLQTKISKNNDLPRSGSYSRYVNGDFVTRISPRFRRSGSWSHFQMDPVMVPELEPPVTILAWLEPSVRIKIILFKYSIFLRFEFPFELLVSVWNHLTDIFLPLFEKNKKTIIFTVWNWRFWFWFHGPETLNRNWSVLPLFPFGTVTSSFSSERWTRVGSDSIRASLIVTLLSMLPRETWKSFYSKSRASLKLKGHKPE